MKLLIGFPMYDEEENVLPLLAQIKEQQPAFERLGYDGLSILAIDNGSTDRTLSLLQKARETIPELRTISFSRNFGYESAMSAIIDHSDADATVLMDGDLQDPPSFIPSLLAKLAEGHDVVYAIRARREETWFRQIMYKLFYRIWSMSSYVSVPIDAGNFCAMTRPVVRTLGQLKERQKFVRGLRAWVGFSQTGAPYNRPIRKHGSTKFPILPALALASDGIFAFSYLPIRLFLLAGFLALLLLLILSIYLIGAKVLIWMGIVDAHFFPTGLIQSNLILIFFSSINLIGLGIIGEYIGRIYEEVKGRPHYIIRGTYPG